MFKPSKGQFECLRDYISLARAMELPVLSLPLPGTPSFELLSQGCLMIVGLHGKLYIQATAYGKKVHDQAVAEENEVAA